METFLYHYGVKGMKWDETKLKGLSAPTQSLRRMSMVEGSTSYTKGAQTKGVKAIVKKDTSNTKSTSGNTSSNSRSSNNEGIVEVKDNEGITEVKDNVKPLIGLTLNTANTSGSSRSSNGTKPMTGLSIPIAKTGNQSNATKKKTQSVVNNAKKITMASIKAPEAILKAANNPLRKKV